MANVAVVERTLALVKPDALGKSEEVLDVIRNNGFTVLQVSSLVHNESEIFKPFSELQHAVTRSRLAYLIAYRTVSAHRCMYMSHLIISGSQNRAKLGVWSSNRCLS